MLGMTGLMITIENSYQQSLSQCHEAHLVCIQINYHDTGHAFGVLEQELETKVAHFIQIAKGDGSL